MKKMFLSLPFSLVFIFSCSTPEKKVNLTDLDTEKIQCGWGTAKQDQSAVETHLSIGGVKYDTGIGVHAESKFLILLNGKGRFFSAFAGVDDASDEKGSVEFFVLGDQRILWHSGIMKKGNPAKKAEVDLLGIEKLGLLVTGGSDGSNRDYADWTEGSIIYAGQVPRAIENAYQSTEEILTPLPAHHPHINGPRRYGVHPGSPFLYRIPATGDRPLVFSATNLPDGLLLDTITGIISGVVSKKGKYCAHLSARNRLGSDERDFTIVAGDTLALTPPMGWNSWYIYYNRVNDSVMRMSADLMIKSGMADFGYQYVNIDDCWAIKENADDPVIGGETRGMNGEIRSNKRFPDMKALTRYIHGKGLKAGIYSSPGPKTCAGYTGSYKHEKQDINTFAQWGFDFLKYDWCSYGRIEKERNREACMKPYQIIKDEIQKVNRDIVLNICQYGMADVWEWGGSLGNSWRTTGDLGILAGSFLPPFYYIGLSNSSHWKFARPGAWNDPDYILIGWIRNALNAEKFEKTSLTPNEQYAYMSMWALMAAPLFYSGDMGMLDPFTLNILCNHEVIDINQDISGNQSQIVAGNDDGFVMVKELDGGMKAVGLFYASGNEGIRNLDLTDREANGMSDVMTNKIDPATLFVWDTQPAPKLMGFHAADLNITGNFSVRDVWRQKDLGIFKDKFETKVPFHGVMLLKVTRLD